MLSFLFGKGSVIVSYWFYVLGASATRADALCTLSTKRGGGLPFINHTTDWENTLKGFSTESYRSVSLIYSLLRTTWNSIPHELIDLLHLNTHGFNT